MKLTEPQAYQLRTVLAFLLNGGESVTQGEFHGRKVEDGFEVEVKGKGLG